MDENKGISFDEDAERLRLRIGSSSDDEGRDEVRRHRIFVGCRLVDGTIEVQRSVLTRIDDDEWDGGGSVGRLQRDLALDSGGDEGGEVPVEEQGVSAGASTRLCGARLCGEEPTATSDTDKDNGARIVSDTSRCG